MKYNVIAYYSQIVEVEAETEDEAINKAQQSLENLNVRFIPDNYEVECLDDNDE